MIVQSFLEFRSRMDRWTLRLVLGVMVVLVAAWVLTLLDAAAGSLAKVTVTLLCFLPLVLLTWVLRGTTYRLTESYLLVRSGPLRYKVRLDSIVSIEPIRSHLSAPALSRDRFRVRYERYSRVEISPQDRKRFLQELAQRAPHLVWQEEKLVSVS